MRARMAFVMALALAWTGAVSVAVPCASAQAGRLTADRSQGDRHGGRAHALYAGGGVQTSSIGYSPSLHSSATLRVPLHFEIRCGYEDIPFLMLGQGIGVEVGAGPFLGLRVSLLLGLQYRTESEREFPTGSEGIGLISNIQAYAGLPLSGRLDAIAGVTLLQAEEAQLEVGARWHD